MLRVSSFCLTGHCTQLRRVTAHAFRRPRWRRRRMAASPPGEQQSGAVGCRACTSIFVSSDTAPCSRASARVLVPGATWMRHFLAKESAGNAGSWRASERLLPKNADASSVDRPTKGTPFRHLTGFRFLRNAGKNEDSHEIVSHGTHDGVP